MKNNENEMKNENNEKWKKVKWKRTKKRKQI